MTTDPAPQMVAAIEALHAINAREYADARSRWRQHVEAAAAQGGSLPQTAVDEVLRDAKLLGYTADDFAADVHAVMEDTRLSAEIEAERSTMMKAATAADDARLEAERLQADYIRERGERDTLIKAIETALQAKRREAERHEAEVMRRGVIVQRAADRQMNFRTARARQRIFG